MDRARLRALLLAAASLALLGGLPACGNRHEVITDAETEGPYLNVGPLKYQVQISRQLNPDDPEDRVYLQGVAADEVGPRANETWFGVFVRVINETDARHLSAAEFEIKDTQGQRFEPVRVGANPFAYRPAELPPRSSLPAQGTLADESAIGGSMLLFKLTLDALANRPLELTIRSPQAAPHEAIVNLDV